MSTPAAPLLSLATAEAIVIGALALALLGVWSRTREPGMPMLAAGFALAAAWYGYSDHLVYTGPAIDTLQMRVWALVIGAAVLAITFGVVQYLGAPAGLWRGIVVGCWIPGIVLLAALAAGRSVPHDIFHVGVLLAYVGAGALALRRAREAPGDGHAALGLALLTLPVLPFALQALGTPPQALGHFAGLSVAVFGTILLAISLLRRHRALSVEIARRTAAETLLRESNAQLESRVAERTAHLHELIDSLEGFTRGVSHDLRGPLGGMSQLARMAQDALARGDASVAERVLPAIAAQCDTSVRTVTTLLELARLGDATARRLPVDLAELARQAFDEVLLSSSPARPPAFTCAPMPAVEADPQLLRPVFVNLIGNAVKFSRDVGDARIEIEARAEGRDVIVCVRDNGVGFAPEVTARLFEPFYRAHDARFEGHGLGLSIVRRAVEAMGGTVWAEPPAGGGARLCFRLPGALAAAGGAAAGDALIGGAPRAALA